MPSFALKSSEQLAQLFHGGEDGDNLDDDDIGNDDDYGGDSYVYQVSLRTLLNDLPASPSSCKSALDLQRRSR